MKKLACLLAVCIILSSIVSCSKNDNRAEIISYIGETDIEINGKTVFTVDDVEEWFEITKKDLITETTTPLIGRDEYVPKTSFLVSWKNDKQPIGKIELYNSSKDAQLVYNEMTLYMGFELSHDVYYRINNMIIVSLPSSVFKFSKALAKTFHLNKPVKHYLKNEVVVKKLDISITMEEIYNYFVDNNFKTVKYEEMKFYSDEQFAVFDESHFAPLFVWEFCGSSDLPKKEEALNFISYQLLDEKCLTIMFYENLVLASYDNSWEKIIPEITK